MSYDFSVSDTMRSCEYIFSKHYRRINQQAEYRQKLTRECKQAAKERQPVKPKPVSQAEIRKQRIVELRG